MPLLSSPRILPALRSSLVRGCRGRARRRCLHAGPGVRRAADDLHDAVAGIDLAHPQLVGIGVLHCLDDVGGDEALELLGTIDHLLDLEAEHGQRLR